MPVGRFEQVSKTALDDAVISAALTLRDVLSRIVGLNAYLDTQTTEALEAIGYSADDVIQLKSMAADLDRLVDVARGNATVAEAYNFFTFVTPHLGIQ